ncbi:MAG: CRTAC1 family protein [Rhodothermales bacterium]|nr:CRTAC1 family protein [Rhodothermales bacterium]
MPHPVALRICAVWFVLPLVVAGCQRANESDDSKTDVRRAQAEIVLELASIADSLNPIDNPWANEERLAFFTSQPVPDDPVDRLQLQGMVAREFLNSGRSELAVNAFSRMLETVQRYPELAPDGYDATLQSMAGLSYLRLGEQQNCLTNHSGGACILPIDEESVHKARKGSEGAVRIYSELLEADPDDLESQWLLNIAHATLGNHPNGVDERFRMTVEQLSGPASEFVKFRNVAHAAGVAVNGLSGGGVTEDFDGDEDLDLIVSSWGLRDSLRYLENTGDGHFVDRTVSAGFLGLTGGLNLIHADYDNDGDFDVFVLRGAWLRKVGAIPNSLLRNDGNGSFTDVTIEAGVYSRHPTQTGAWADYDNDGLLDLFVGNEAAPDEPHPSELFHNNGDGTFTDVAAIVGLDISSYVKGCTWIDYDNDGDPDLYLSILGQPNRLFANEGGVFSEVTTAGIEEPYHSFPTWSWDYDNDGWEDLLVLPYEADLKDYVTFQLGQKSDADTPRLYRNQGDGTFADVAESVGLGIPLKAMGSNFGDLDNDGLLDFYVGTGDPDLRTLVPNKMYRNTKTGFVDITRPGGFGHLQKGHAVSFSDLDNDGDQDVHAVMGGALSGDRYQNVLFENPGSANAWITLRLVGTRSNTNAIGARISVSALSAGRAVREIHRTVDSGGSFGGSSYRSEIGLGPDVDRVDITIRWPSGETQRFESVVTNQSYIVEENRDDLRSLEYR